MGDWDWAERAGDVLDSILHAMQGGVRDADIDRIDSDSLLAIGVVRRRPCLGYVIGCDFPHRRLGVVSYGMIFDSLPTASLNFRWRYWVAAWQVFLAHPIIGVGWNNFGVHYQVPACGSGGRNPGPAQLRAAIHDRTWFDRRVTRHGLAGRLWWNYRGRVNRTLLRPSLNSGWDYSR